jgi:Protein of unknown function (DUF1616)
MVQSKIDKLRLQDMIFELLHKNRSMKVRDMVDILLGIDNSLAMDDIYNAVEFLKQENLVITSYKPFQNQNSFYGYIARTYASLPFWLVVAITVLTLVSIYFVPSSSAPLSTIRYIVGAIFVLILPGFSILQLVFPTKDISNLERLALSLALSLALVPLIGLVMAYTPLGIRLLPLVIFLSLLCISISIIGAYRKYRISKSHV